MATTTSDMLSSKVRTGRYNYRQGRYRWMLQQGVDYVVADQARCWSWRKIHEELGIDVPPGALVVKDKRNRRRKIIFLDD